MAPDTRPIRVAAENGGRKAAPPEFIATPSTSIPRRPSATAPTGRPAWAPRCGGRRAAARATIECAAIDWAGLGLAGLWGGQASSLQPERLDRALAERGCGERAMGRCAW